MLFTRKHSVIAMAFALLSIGSVSQARAATGKLAFGSVRDGRNQIYVMNADGTDQTNITNTAFQELDGTFSPDGARIVFTSMRDGNPEIYIMNADGTGQTRLTNTPLKTNRSPVFSHDGTKIAFVSDRLGVGQVFVMNADGSNQTGVTGVHMRPPAVPVFRPDGTKLLFESFNGVAYDIHQVNADGTGDIVLLANSGDGSSHPSYSPDGTRIVFSQLNQVSGIYSMNADGTGVTTLATVGGGSDPGFNPDGTQISFTSMRSRPAAPGVVGDPEVWIMNADGSNPVQLTFSTTVVFPSFTLATYNYQPSWTIGAVGAPAPLVLPSLAALSLNPSTVVGGNLGGVKTAQGTIALTGPAPTGSASVALGSSNTAVANVLNSIIIPAGANSATFFVNTAPVTTTTSVTISALYNGTTLSAVLTLTAAAPPPPPPPPPPPAVDQVSLQKAEYTVSKQQLLVQATTSSSTAALQAFASPTRSLIGSLTKVGPGKYQGQFSWPSNPQTITVTSSAGGSGSSTVQAK